MHCIPKIYPKYAQDMPNTCSNMPRIFPRCAKDTTKTPKRYIQERPKKNPSYAKDIHNICPEYVQGRDEGGIPVKQTNRMMTFIMAQVPDDL